MKQNLGYKLDEVVEKSGITQRNVKFWCAVYNIKPKKIGRSNYYSELQFQTLKLINFLSNSNLFTQKFVRLIADYNIKQDKTESLSACNNFVNELNLLLSENTELAKLNFNIFSMDSQFINLTVSEKFKHNSVADIIKKEPLKKTESIFIDSKADKKYPINKTVRENTDLKPEKQVDVQIKDVSAKSLPSPVKKQDSYLL
ncbi:MerR family transcriptional regulator [Candidatus Dependentiae bacterium]|nr:MerR family transcriptional regulator [Candidatus Dependentiae bacterium]